MRKSSNAPRTASPRPDRVGDSIRQALGVALLRDVSDVRLSGVGVTDVRVTADIRHATIYWQLLNPDASERQIRQTERAIRAAAGYFRSVIAQALDLKFTPELTFAFDDSIERGRRMEALIADISRGEAAQPGAPTQTEDDDDLDGPG